MDKEYAEFMDETKVVRSKVKKWFFILFFLSIIFSIGGYFLGMFKANVTDNAFIRYEEFQEIYNTCQKLNTDLGIYNGLPEDDKMFEQFSKVQRVAALKSNLNRWVEEYNAKSKMWNRALWKSEELPYQLTVQQFNNYQE
jgi:hypothetical protein